MRGASWVPWSLTVVGLACAAPASAPKPDTGPPADSDATDSDTADSDSALPGDDAPPEARVLLQDLPLVRISSGTFTMGSPESEAGRVADETQHPVTLTRSFYMGETPITRGQYRARMGSLPDEADPCDDTCPVRRLRWHDAAAFANAVSRAEGLPECFACSGEPSQCVVLGDPYACAGVRLPTEAEWEYAARAGHHGPFQAGGQLSPEDVDACDPDVTLDDGTPLSDFAWFCGTSEMWVQPVGQLAPNAWGLYDLSGNVYEWLADWAGEAHGSDPVTDPTGPVEGRARLHRGGSWGSVPRNARLAARTYNTPDEGQAGSGMRIVWTAP